MTDDFEKLDEMFMSLGKSIIQKCPDTPVSLPAASRKHALNKKYIFSVIAAALLIVAMVTMLSMNITRKMTAVISDISGNSSIVKDFEITGEVTSFNDPELFTGRTRYMAHRKIQTSRDAPSPYYFIYYRRDFIGNYTYSKTAYLTICTDVWGEAPANEVNEYLFRPVGDKLYFYTRTGINNSGTGGVYEVSEFIGSKQSVTPKNIAPVDLKFGECRIMGFDASEKYLAVITLEKDLYQCRVYTTDGVQTATVDLFEANEENEQSETELIGNITLIAGDYLYVMGKPRIVNLKTGKLVDCDLGDNMKGNGPTFAVAESDGTTVFMKEVGQMLIIKAYRNKQLVYSGMANITNIKNIRIKSDRFAISHSR